MKDTAILSILGDIDFVAMCVTGADVMAASDKGLRIFRKNGVPYRATDSVGPNGTRVQVPLPENLTRDKDSLSQQAANNIVAIAGHPNSSKMIDLVQEQVVVFKKDIEKTNSEDQVVAKKNVKQALNSSFVQKSMASIIAELGKINGNIQKGFKSGYDFVLSVASDPKTSFSNSIDKISNFMMDGYTTLSMRHPQVLAGLLSGVYLGMALWWWSNIPGAIVKIGSVITASGFLEAGLAATGLSPAVIAITLASSSIYAIASALVGLICVSSAGRVLLALGDVKPVDSSTQIPTYQELKKRKQKEKEYQKEEEARNSAAWKDALFYDRQNDDDKRSERTARLLDSLAAREARTGKNLERELNERPVRHKEQEEAEKLRRKKLGHKYAFGELLMDVSSKNKIEEINKMANSEKPNKETIVKKVREVLRQ